MALELLEQFFIFLRLVLAGVLAAAIGYDRESAGRPAGLRTHVLVGVSSCLLVSLGEVVLYTVEGADAARVDPLRVLEAIVTGVSFIGAGTIFRAEGAVRGITTAGSLLGTAALGAAVGFELYVLGVLTTALLYFVLRAVRALEHRSPSPPLPTNHDVSPFPVDSEGPSTPGRRPSSPQGPS